MKLSIDNAPTLEVLKMLMLCASSWEDDVRLIGNIRACDIVRACDEAIRCMTGNFMIDTDNAPVIDVLRMLEFCAASWEGEARLVGNIRACDIRRACDEAIRCLITELESEE